jgi:hypothetical protein
VKRLLESPNSLFVRDFEPGHFYSPLPDIQEVRRLSVSKKRSAASVAGIDLNVAVQTKLLEELAEFYSEIPFEDSCNGRLRYYFNNSYFSFGDGILLYAMLRRFKPRRVVEIGSGFSSAEMLDVDELFLKKGTEFVFIEPFPDRFLSLLKLGDELRINIRCEKVQDVGMDVFRDLEAGDILFIDSSHVGKAGSDVLHLIFTVLPALKAGVLIHVHDVLWPFDYPQNWFEGGRAWNEAYFMRAFLQFNRSFEIVQFNSYLVESHRSLIESHMPGMLKTPSNPQTEANASLWIRKVA